MELGLFQNQPGDKYKFDDLTCWYQKRSGDPDPESIHGELIFRDGAMYSSSGRGGLFAGHGLWPGVGTRFIHLRDIEPHKWKRYPLLISRKKEDQIREDCESQKPLAYDWLGILGQPLPGNIQWPWAVYCTETCNDKICHRIKTILYKPKMRPGEILDWYRAEGLIGG